MTYEMTVIVPNHKEDLAVHALLASLAKQKTSFKFRVIVVSNPPSQSLAVDLAVNQDALHFQQEVVGVNAARNRGLREAHTELLFFTDADCKFEDENLLQKHRDLHLRHPEASCIGGVYSNSSPRILDIVYNYIQTKWLLQGKSHGSSRHLIGGHFSCKSQEIKKFLFDEKITYGGSETELFLRMHQSGKIFLLFPELTVAHNTHLTRADFVKKIYRQGAGASYIEKKLNVEIANTEISKEAVEYERKSYRKQMDFWLYLSQKAHREGFQNGGQCSYFRFFALYTSSWFVFTTTQLSDSFRSLEGLLRNLPRK